jgi:hypothetical protein
MEFSEYVGTIRVEAASETIEIEFDDSVIIDQIAFNSSTSNVYKVELVYPSSEDTVMLKAASGSGDWALNDSSSSGTMWHRLPKRGKVRLTVSNYYSAESVTLAILGRAG